ncbi:MAG: hypothetical protein GEV00_22415, partial [Actinophytocola sp.]|nr:hypothetical protein [Actinophytocola sp.]
MLDVVACGFEPIQPGCGGSGGFVEQESKFVSSALQFGEFGSELVDTVRAGRFGQASVLEGCEVALDGFLGFGKFAFDGGKFLAEFAALLIQ